MSKPGEHYHYIPLSIEDSNELVKWDLIDNWYEVYDWLQERPLFDMVEGQEVACGPSALVPDPELDNFDNYAKWLIDWYISPVIKHFRPKLLEYARDGWEKNTPKDPEMVLPHRAIVGYLGCHFKTFNGMKYYPETGDWYNPEKKEVVEGYCFSIHDHWPRLEDTSLEEINGEWTCRTHEDVVKELIRLKREGWTFTRAIACAMELQRDKEKGYILWNPDEPNFLTSLALTLRQPG